MGKIAKPVSAAEANREFSRLLQDVKKGHTFLVTNHGKPVAKIGPIGDAEDSKIAKKARTVLLSRLQSEPVLETGGWTRDELYER